jgi:hypothetical protein
MIMAAPMADVVADADADVDAAATTIALPLIMAGADADVDVDAAVGADVMTLYPPFPRPRAKAGKIPRTRAPGAVEAEDEVDLTPPVVPQNDRGGLFARGDLLWKVSSAWGTMRIVPSVSMRISIATPLFLMARSTRQISASLKRAFRPIAIFRASTVQVFIEYLLPRRTSFER